MKTLEEIVRELEDAGGFGDGIDTGKDHPIEVLVSSQLTAEQRLAASLALVCRLAEAVDNTTWKEATRSALARRTHEFFEHGGVLAPECTAAVLEFSRSEEGFWSALQALYQNVISMQRQG